MSASPAANRRAVAIVFACRAARASAVGCLPAVRNSRCASVAVAYWGTGGSCDRPPEPMNSTRRSVPRKYSPTACPNARTRDIGTNGRATEFTKTGRTGRAAASPSWRISIGCTAP